MEVVDMCLRVHCTFLCKLKRGYIVDTIAFPRLLLTILYHFMLKTEDINLSVLTVDYYDSMLILLMEWHLNL